MPVCLTADELHAFVCGHVGVVELDVEAHLTQCYTCLDAANSIATDYFHLVDDVSGSEVDLENVSQVIRALTQEGITEPTVLFSRELAPESLFGNYRIKRLLGRGGMGTVYLAEEIRLERLVALKLVNPNRLNRSEKQRFIDEARATVNVDSPHLATVFNCDEVDGIPFIAFQYFPGKTLHDLLKENGQLPTEKTCQIGIQICDGLAAIHRKGFIHCDLKPQNILIEQTTGEARILDFGLVVRHAGDEQNEIRALGGTPRYMSPEQATGKPIDPRSDLFSLGAVLYEMATGTSAFQGTSGTELLYSVGTQTPKPPAQVTNVGAALSTVIMQLLDKEPGNRPESAGSVAASLSDILDTRKTGRFLKWTKSTLAASVIAILLSAYFIHLVLLRFTTEHGIVELRINGADSPLQVDVSQDRTLQLNDPIDGELLTIQVDRVSDRLLVSKDGFDLYTTNFMARLKNGHDIEARLIPAKQSQQKPSAEEPFRIGSVEWVFAIRKPANAVGQLLGIGFATFRRDEKGDWQPWGKEAFSPPNHPRIKLTPMGTRQQNGDTYFFYRFSRYGLDVPMNADASYSIRAVVSGNIDAFSLLGIDGGSSRQLINGELGVSYPHAINILIKGTDNSRIYHSKTKDIQDIDLATELIPSMIREKNTASDFLVSFVQLNPKDSPPEKIDNHRSELELPAELPQLTIPFDPVTAQATNLAMATPMLAARAARTALVPPSVLIPSGSPGSQGRSVRAP